MKDKQIIMYKPPKKKLLTDYLIFQSLIDFSKYYDNKYEEYFKYLYLGSKPFGHLFYKESKQCARIFPIWNEETLRIHLSRILLNKIKNRGYEDEITLHGQLKSSIKEQVFQRKHSRLEKYSVFPDIELFHIKRRGKSTKVKNKSYEHNAIELKFRCWENAVKEDIQKCHHYVHEPYLEFDRAWFFGIDLWDETTEFHKYKRWHDINKVGWFFLQPKERFDPYNYNVQEISNNNRSSYYILYRIKNDTRMSSIISKSAIVQDWNNYCFLYMHVKLIDNKDSWFNPCGLTTCIIGNRLLFLLCFWRRKKSFNTIKIKLSNRGYDDWYFFDFDEGKLYKGYQNYNPVVCLNSIDLTKIKSREDLVDYYSSSVKILRNVLKSYVKNIR